MKKISSKFIKFIAVSLFILIFISIINSCGNKSDTTVENKEINKDTAAVKEDKHESKVSLTEEQIKLMGIETDELKKQNLAGYIKVSGEIITNQDNESKVGSIISGRVKKIYVKEGSYVRNGQTLAVIENPELIDVQVAYISAKNEYNYTKTEYERQLKLNKDNIGSKKNLAELESNYKRALISYKTLEEKLSSYKISKNRFDNLYQDTVANLQKYYTITAPISGYIVSRLITVGQFVESSTDMFHIVNNSTVYADLNVFENVLPYISSGQKVTVEVNVNPYEAYEGSVSFVNKVFDDKNRTVKVRVLINNKNQKLLPFMFVNAKIYVNESSVLAIPVSALETEGDEKYIFVRTNGRSEIKDFEANNEQIENSEENRKQKQNGIVFKKIALNTGIFDDKFIEVFPIESIDIGATIVTKGTFYLKSELKKDELSGEE